MTITEVTDRVMVLGNVWEQFKQVNDSRLNEIERKGYADPLYNEHLNNINHTLDNYKQRLDQIETAYNRPSLGMDVGGLKIAEPMKSEYSKAFRNYLRKGMDAGLEALKLKRFQWGLILMADIW